MGLAIVFAAAVGAVAIPHDHVLAISLAANPDAYSVRHDHTLTVPAPGVLGNDVTLLGTSTAVRDSWPSHGSLTLQPNGAFTYTPTAGYVGIDTFRYHVHDTLLIIPTDTLPTTVTITVINTTPVAHDDAYTASTGVTKSVPAPGVLGNDTDTDGDALTAQVVDKSGNGSIDLNPDGSFTFTSGGSFSGPRTFTYRVWDGVAWSATATVTITVSPTSTPTPGPTPSPTPTPKPAPTALPLPTALPIPTRIPIPSLIPIPTLQVPIPTSTATPPAPTPTPDRSPDSTAPAGAVVLPPRSGGSTTAGPGPNGAPGDPGLELDGGAPFGDLDGLGFTGFGGFDWAVPSLVLSVPGLLLILALLAQGGVGLFSLPVVRRSLGNFGLRRRRVGEIRIR